MVKLADFGVSVMARSDAPAAAGQRAISPLIALLTGEVDENDATESSLAESDFDDLPTNERKFRQGQNKLAATPRPGPGPAPVVGEDAQRKSQERADDLTEIGAIVGTPMYMAPEISFGSRHAQASSDVFSFGVIAYELLTKELPFKKPPVGSVMRQETLVLPHGLRKRADLDKTLISLLERAMNVDPAQRPTASQLAEALAQAVAETQRRASQPVGGPTRAA